MTELVETPGRNRWARLAWMANHLCWAAALFVSVQTGWLYSEVCDDAYTNGNNGPFGYGQHGGRSNLILLLLVAGLAGAIALPRVFRDDQTKRLRVPNLVIGTIGGAVALGDLVKQNERNPYCTSSGIWPTLTIALCLLVFAALVNFGAYSAVLHRLHQRFEAFFS